MESKSGLVMHGSLELVLVRANGEVVTRRKDNLIVDAGFDLICDSVGKTASRPAAVGWIAIGTGAVAAAAANTTLGAEVARGASTYGHTTGTKVFTHAATFAPGSGTGAITEAGCLNAASVGSLLDRVVFSVINKGAGDSLTATFTFTLT